MPDQEQNQNQTPTKTPKATRRPSARELEGKAARLEAKLKKIEDQKLELAASLEATKKLMAERKEKEDRKARAHRLILMGEILDDLIKKNPPLLQTLIEQAEDRTTADDTTKKEKTDSKTLLAYFTTITPEDAQE